MAWLWIPAVPFFGVSVVQLMACYRRRHRRPAIIAASSPIPPADRAECEHEMVTRVHSDGRGYSAVRCGLWAELKIGSYYYCLDHGLAEARKQAELGDFSTIRVLPPDGARKNSSYYHL